MSGMVEVPEYQVSEGIRVEPQRTALVVVDMQNDFVKEGGALRVPDAEGTIPVIQGLLALARDSEMRVIFTQDTHHQGMGFTPREEWVAEQTIHALRLLLADVKCTDDERRAVEEFLALASEEVPGSL